VSASDACDMTSDSVPSLVYVEVTSSIRDFSRFRSVVGHSSPCILAIKFRNSPLLAEARANLHGPATRPALSERNRVLVRPAAQPTSARVRMTRTGPLFI
jgi:hypothetical protein